MIEYGVNITLNDDDLSEVKQDAESNQAYFSSYREAYDYFYESMLTSKIQSFEGS